MGKNTFKLGNATVNIEGGFIPCGREYVILRQIIEQKAERRGYFGMNFTVNQWGCMNVLKVNYSKK